MYNTTNLDNQFMEKKLCPYCREEILKVAKKCKHCGKWLDDENDLKKPPQEPTSVISQDADENNQRSGKSKYLLLGIFIGLLCVIFGAYYLLKPKQEQLYLMDIMKKNSDYSCFIGIATNDFDDRLGIGKGWVGTFHIVTHKPEDKPGQLTSVFCGNEAEGFIYGVYPSSKYPNLVYFTGQKYEDFESFYGKLDINSRKYDLFKGEAWGVIVSGKYKDCYLALRNSGLAIYPQSPVGEAYDPIMSFNPKKYFGNVELYDPEVQRKIIRWVEEQ